VNSVAREHQDIWKVIRKNSDKIGELEKDLATNDEKTNTILSIVKDISKDIKDITNTIHGVQIDQNTMNTKAQIISSFLNWKVILAFVAGAGIVIAALQG
jgi:archaellum component FlaC